MSGDNHNTNAAAPTALNRRPKGAIGGTPIRPGATNGQAVLDRMNAQPDADQMCADRASSLRHLAQPGGLGLLSTRADVNHEDGNGVHLTLPDSVSGNSTVKQWAAAARQRASVVVGALSVVNRTPFVFAGLALLLGYAWLLAGVDKLLLGNFPAQLTQILMSTLRGDTIPGFFTGFLRAMVLPNTTLFGLVAEYGETLAGLGLIAAGLAILFTPPLERRMAPPIAQWIARMRALLVALGMLAAIGTVLLGVTYYLLDGAPFQGFMPSVAFDGAVDPGLQLALGGLVLLLAAMPGRMKRRSRPHLLATPLVHRDERNDGQ